MARDELQVSIDDKLETLKAVVSNAHAVPTQWNERKIVAILRALDATVSLLEELARK